jgi:DNA-binding NtrC family response regulator
LKHHQSNDTLWERGWHGVQETGMTQKRFGRIVGESPRMRQVFRLIQRAAEVDAPVLITGEKGTGKELVARELHRRSKRVDGPFVVVSTREMPAGQFMSALFGSQEGGPPPSNPSGAAFIEQARRGTLYIREAAVLDEQVQLALLRVIEEGVYRPPGAPEDVESGVRLIMATTADLEQEAAAGCFREDLLQRLQVLCIPVPPLRDRADDIEMLAEACLEDLASQHGQGVERISAAAYSALRNYPWPGNMAEMPRVLSQAAAAAGGGILRPEHLPAAIAACAGLLADAAAEDEPQESESALDAQAGYPEETAGLEEAETPENGLQALEEGVFIPLGMTFDEAMHTYASVTLRHFGQNKTKAAQVLGVSRKTLYERLSRWEKGLTNDS